MNQQIVQLMNGFRNQIPNAQSISWNAWTNDMLNNGNPYYQQFINLLNQLPENNLRTIYKNFRSKPPTIIYKDIADKFVKFYTNNNGITPILNANPSLNLIIELLAYTLVVEAVIPNYFDRIDERFGWANM